MGDTVEMDAGTECCGRMRDRAAMRRRRIIDAARILFVNNGFHATGVAQIARGSGVAVGQIYRDFEAKEDIVAAIVDADCYAFLERESLRHAIESHDEQQVWDWIREFVRPTRPSGTEPLFAEIVAESTRNARIAAIFARTHAAVETDVQDALAMLAPGDIHAARRAVVADLVLTQSLGLMQDRLLRPGRDTATLVDAFLAIVAEEIAAMRG